ncbi:putative quinol monooxygenase [Streptococcus henryi]|uniref:putative quinol monooxygenase n=1 Tax=Streptococcus henryi TaxID=439219 RepID=UPI000373B72C|nr:antibiotic biosynthesis monooxygenase [Streptococcus henryi]
MTKPIFRIFKLGMDLAYEADYDQVGYDNLTKSIDMEAGTMAMFANHLQGDKSQQVVVEVYKDEAAYQEHIASAHFKAFAGLAGKALTSREVISLEAKALYKKAPAIKVTEANDLAIRLAHVQVKDSQAFADIVLPEMKTSIDLEEGVLLMFAGQDVSQPDHWYFYEIYANQAAYDSHCLTAHFKDYISRSADLVLEKELQQLSGDILVSKASE